MSSNSKVSLDEVKWLVWLFLGWTLLAGQRSCAAATAGQQTATYAVPSAAARCEWSTSPSSRPSVLSEHALAYLDSG